ARSGRICLSSKINKASMKQIKQTTYQKKAKGGNEKHRRKAMMAALGYATASSMANVVNRLFQEELFESFDMTLDLTPQ
ncbi:hypothetical protein KYX90_13735, partial [Enterococcus lactis]|nr:hypothetical protein [Enterococcus lactis]